VVKVRWAGRGDGRDGLVAARTAVEIVRVVMRVVKRILGDLEGMKIEVCIGRLCDRHNNYKIVWVMKNFDHKKLWATPYILRCTSSARRQ
jgi:hypothetical protein